jgi:2',3'-cyclic-nucleotide 2'-phosphodiesterase (5'-nucleotidase family)
MFRGSFPFHLNDFKTLQDNSSQYEINKDCQLKYTFSTSGYNFTAQLLIMRQFFFVLLTTVVFIAPSCKTPGSVATSTTDDGNIDVVFVQVNDVYEIAPVSAGKEGGMARVATLKKQYLKENRNTFLVMAGDFLSPSVYNSLKYNGQRVRGAQMVESMNAAGVDLVAFGNHEFDISEAELQQRINESEFNWVSTNTFHKTKDRTEPFNRIRTSAITPIPDRVIMDVKDQDGTTARIGFIGITLPSNPAEFVSYNDPLSSAKAMYNKIKDSVDAVVAITHQAIADDIILAKELPGVAVVLGGHEHGMVFEKVGNVNITKAHANARSAYVVKLNINKMKKQLKVEPQLTYLNEQVAFDSSTNIVVEKWKKIADDNFASIGFDPRKVLMTTGEPLDGRESEIRTRPTNLTSLVSAAMAFACPIADVVVYNSGSIRVDDILTPPITQYDIIRSLPFGGGIREMEMKGSLLLQMLEAGMKNKNSGGYLQHQPVSYNAATNVFSVNNSPIDIHKTYRVAMSDFLFSGKETNLAFVNEKNSDITKVYPAETAVNNPKSDIRLAIVKFLESTK